MKLSVAVLIAGLLPVGGVFADEALQANIEEGKGLIKAYMGNLKAELQKSMKEGGPVKSIGVCNTVAPQITEAHSQMSGWQVGRTSLIKVRNPDNAPDAWEQAVLQEFENRKAGGEDPMQLIKAEVVEEQGEDEDA